MRAKFGPLRDFMNLGRAAANVNSWIFPSMALFLSILLMLTVAVLFSRLASALSVPYPAFLALGGALIAVLPGTPSINLDPSLALAIFVAPVLADAAFLTSLRDLRDYRLSIILLVVMAVSVTTAAAAIVFHSLVPGVPWAAAVALGAIVAPPDATAATAVLREIKLQSRVRAILEGESLFNDASALLIFAVALRLAQDGHATLTSLIPSYMLSVIGSIALGLLLARIVPLALRLAKDAPTSIILQFCSIFGIWILARIPSSIGDPHHCHIRNCPCAIAAPQTRASFAREISCRLGNGCIPSKRTCFHPHRHAARPPAGSSKSR